MLLSLYTGETTRTCRCAPSITAIPSRTRTEPRQGRRIPLFQFPYRPQQADPLSDFGNAEFLELFSSEFEDDAPCDIVVFELCGMMSAALQLQERIDLSARPGCQMDMKGDVGWGPVKRWRGWALHYGRTARADLVFLVVVIVIRLSAISFSSFLPSSVHTILIALICIE